MSRSLDEAWDAFTSSAFRLETLQNYELGEDGPRRQAFADGRPLPPRPGKAQSLAMVHAAVGAGKRVYRCHLVRLPLSDYMRYEMAVYPENVAAGEGVLIADYDAHPGLAGLGTDFWLFDAETTHPSVVWFRYAGGRAVRRMYADDPLSVALAVAQRDLAVAHAVPLAEFAGAR